MIDTDRLFAALDYEYVKGNEVGTQKLAMDIIKKMPKPITKAQINTAIKIGLIRLAKSFIADKEVIAYSQLNEWLLLHSCGYVLINVEGVLNKII